MRLFLLVLLVGALAVGKLSSQSATPPPGRTVTEAEYERWKTELTNWGRWGQDDQIGALNLITPAKRRQAAALVKEGFSVSLAGDVDTVQAVDNWHPYEHTMLTIGKDRIAVNYHGIAHSHLDSLAHMNANGVFYNGYTPDPETVLKEGHSKNSIHNVKNGIFTRGILIDIPRLKGVPYLEPGTPIYVEDLEAWEQKAGVKVSSGDVLFVRTGPVASHGSWGCAVRAHGRVGPPEGQRAVAPRQERRRPLGRARSLGDPVVETARRLGHGERPSAVCVPVASHGSCSRFRLDLLGSPLVRQSGSRSPCRCGGRPKPVGISADGGSAADSWRHRITFESHRDILMDSPSRMVSAGEDVSLEKAAAWMVYKSLCADKGGQKRIG